MKMLQLTTVDLWYRDQMGHFMLGKRIWQQLYLLTIEREAFAVLRAMQLCRWLIIRALIV
jgi:hypothetical protein